MNELEKEILEIKSIACFIQKHDKQEIRDLKLKDLYYKCNNLTMKTDKEKFDIAIFTTNTKELDSFNKLIKFSDGNYFDEYKSINGLPVWKFKLGRKKGKELNVLITCVGEAGQISCTLGTFRVLEHFDIGFVMLSGIAAGLLDNYSVVLSEGVVDYEHQRLELNNIQFRPEPIMVGKKVKRSFTHFHTMSEQIKNELMTNVKKHPLYNKEEFNIKDVFSKFQIKSGIIASGEKLVADGVTLKKLNEKIKIEKGIIAVEMEGSGFSQVCDELNKPWIVIRGISDDGGEEKDKALNKKYQFVAASSAAIASLFYLKNYYRTQEDIL